MNKIEKALTARGLRHFFGEIERNPATRGEYVLWPDGIPVATVREAVAVAERRKAAEADSEE